MKFTLLTLALVAPLLSAPAIKSNIVSTPFFPRKQPAYPVTIPLRKTVIPPNFPPFRPQITTQKAKNAVKMISTPLKIL
ncbi:hypothetical protein CONCODRAFT_9944 [Conidiobolus coronatus NRRL 28638]|uniref:Uncharacterized protein n=1 Tax=Conidiobolus coronatus (strain ATCC 28846 / CBS 209.66 / NRRL 28638) TaxID=796925 RepID=A0A137NYH0_CONC2|nr:hypothetical protein CONCODRAFT_9944 [Conidiobolus coronatus NRRL 28638]|eukprot:KXN67910.1 hypothetical protein CONCODRAFT_9944 [Conidiobolus coronatus NRRL 28638]